MIRTAIIIIIKLGTLDMIAPQKKKIIKDLYVGFQFNEAVSAQDPENV